MEVFQDYQEYLGGRLAQSSNLLEEQLAREIVASERKRATILACILGFVLTLSFTLLYLAPAPFLDDPKTLLYLRLLLASVIAYELAARAMMGRLLEAGRAVPGWAFYLNSVIEASLPTAAMLIIAQKFQPLQPLSTALPFVYLIMILLSTLRLDFRHSIFIGAVAAAEYVALAFHLIGRTGTEHVDPIAVSPLNHIGRAMVILIGGLVAGFVGTQIRRRVLDSFRIVEERNQLVGLFGQQVSPAIVEDLMRKQYRVTSELKFVCVMFLDIRDFTPFAEQHTPQEVVGYLNMLFVPMIEIITRHHGIINQFVGDGFMATFGAPLSNGNDCSNAVAAATEILEHIRTMVGRQAIPETRIGIGIHAGEAVVGNVGSSIRQQYSITGTVVILASRIEQLNKHFDSSFLVSRDVWEQAGATASHEPLGPVQVKGHGEPIEIYRIG
jgi:adenylate cyclase